MAIDLSQFHQIFFEESLEGLDALESALLESVKTGEVGADTINTVFRAAHSIKGGSGTFGFNDIALFTHQLETLLEQIRSGERHYSDDLVDLTFRSCDVLRRMIAGYQQKMPVDPSQWQDLLAEISAVLSDENNIQPESVSQQSSSGEEGKALIVQTLDNMLTEPVSENVRQEQSQRWFIHFVPAPEILLSGNEPLRIFRELSSLGDLTVNAELSNLPDFSNLSPDECYLSWKLCLEADVGKESIEEVFEWVDDSCSLEIKAIEKKIVPQKDSVVKKKAPANDVGNPEDHKDESSVGEKGSVNKQVNSIRIGTEKIDDLINLLGELVITQSMLNDMADQLDRERFERLLLGLQQLNQQTRDLQESVMRIRMMPISFVFNRFPRMVHDLSAKLDKYIDLMIAGEATELDKTVMERISDPLMHLVRNAVDHGIESASVRKQIGKPEKGVVALNAYHQGGNVIIEIKDDGAGIDIEKIRQKAVQKEMIEISSDLSDEELLNLIFSPGFSTRDEVSDVSGRGVGMDVVRENIRELGGTVSVESKVGEGALFRIQLPLTLAIIDGQLLDICGEVFVVPLLNIVESVQVSSCRLRKAASNQWFYASGNESIPVISLSTLFDYSPAEKIEDKDLLVVVESSGQKLALWVQDLLWQQQVVIKDISKNYRAIKGVSGATILGDGRVALILDVAGLCKRLDESAGQGGLYAVA